MLRSEEQIFMNTNAAFKANSKAVLCRSAVSFSQPTMGFSSSKEILDSGRNYTLHLGETA
jgi:hypothetical protein